MDHWTIDADNVDNIAERYVTGRLSAAEAASFEEHYLDCPACCARIEAAERLERGLRRLAEEAATRAGSGSPVRPARSWSPASAPLSWGLAAAALLAIALLPAGFELRQVRRLRADLDSAQGALARAQKAPVPVPSQPAQAAPDRERLAALETELRDVRREIAADRQPQTNLPVLLLTPVRDGLGGGPVHSLTLPREPGWVALWVEPGGNDYPYYRATLENAQGKAVFKASGLAVNDLGALLVTVHSTSLAPGTYRLSVDGVPPSGAPVPVARFPLRITANTANTANTADTAPRNPAGRR